MSRDAFKSFLERCAQDPEFSAEMRKSADADSFIKAANDAGYSITIADWLRNQAEIAIQLSDEELEKAAAGNPEIFEQVTGNITDQTMSFVVGGDCMPDKSGFMGSAAHWNC